MGTILAPTCVNQTMAYHENKAYFTIKNTYSLVVSKFFSSNWSYFFNSNLFKQNDLPVILDKLISILQFTMGRNTAYLPFLDIRISKTGNGI